MNWYSAQAECNKYGMSMLRISTAKKVRILKSCSEYPEIKRSEYWDRHHHNDHDRMNGWTSGCGRRNCSKSQEMFWESGLELKVVIIFIWNISSQFIAKLYILHILKCRDDKFELRVCLGRWRHHWSYWRWHAQYNRLWLKKSKESLQLQESGEYDNHCGWRQQIFHHRWMFIQWNFTKHNHDS